MLGICLAVSLASAPLAGCSIFGGGSRPTEPAETTAPAETDETTEAALNEESRASAGTVETLSAEEREELRKKAKELENPVKETKAAGTVQAGSQSLPKESGNAAGSSKTAEKEAALESDHTPGVTVGAAPAGNGKSKGGARYQAPPATGTAEANAASLKDVVILGQGPKPADTSSSEAEKKTEKQSEKQPEKQPEKQAAASQATAETTIQTAQTTVQTAEQTTVQAAQTSVQTTIQAPPEISGEIHYVSGDIRSTVNPAGQIGPDASGSNTGQPIYAGGLGVGPGGGSTVPQGTSVHINTSGHTLITCLVMH